MDPLPTVGSVLVARYPRRLRSAGVDEPVIDIRTGTLLEVTRVDGGWDHTHAMIMSTYQYTLHLRILDGSSAGEVVTATTKGEVIRALGQDEPESTLPGWLESSSTAAAG